MVNGVVIRSNSFGLSKSTERGIFPLTYQPVRDNIEAAVEDRVPVGLFISLLISGAGPTERLASFERHMAAREYSEASRIVDEMVLARPAGPLRPDPLLSGLEGRLLLLRAPPSLALAYLRHADDPEVPDQQREAALLALADTRERLGDRAAAAATYAKLVRLPLSAEARQRALLGAARMRLAEAPQEALAAAQELAASAAPQQRWEAVLVAAEAQLLLGRLAAARAAAEEAWSAAARAPAADFAPLRVAAVRAAIAAVDGDRDATVAALGAASASHLTLETNLLDALPVCGEGGVRPDDWSMFVLFTDSQSGESLTPVAASGAKAAATFADALGGRPLMSGRRLGRPPGGTIVSVRCRTAPAANYHSPQREPDRWAAWFADRGLFFPLSDGELPDINRLSGQIEELARADANDPRLIALRLALAGFLRARAVIAQDVEQWQVTQLDAQVKSGMRRIGGLEGFLFDLWDLAERIPRQNINRATALSQIRVAFDDYLAKAPIDMAYEATFILFAEDSGLPVEIKRRWLEILARRFASNSKDPRKAAVQLMLIDTNRSPLVAPPAGKTSRPGAIADDLCAAADEEPKIIEHHIAPADFPNDLRTFGLQGVNAVDMNVTADGKVGQPRIILSSPSGLFDAALIRRVPDIAMKPALREGRARACRGAVQRIVWKLPEPEGPGLPTFVAPGTTG